MKTILLSATALALAAAPALAQTQPPAPEGTENAPMSAPATTETPAAEPAPAAPAAPAAAQPTDPATILKNEFPAFDTDKSGELNNAEFTAWMEALRKNSPGQTLTPEQQTAWITQSFAQADTSKNGTIALDELTKFLVKGS